MSYLILSDGTRKEVSYGTAVAVNDILEGRKTPKTSAQKEFCSKVHSVEFTQLPIAKLKQVSPVPTHDPRIDEILNDYTLKGRAKLHAVGNRIRERLGLPPRSS